MFGGAGQGVVSNRVNVGVSNPGRQRKSNFGRSELRCKRRTGMSSYGSHRWKGYDDRQTKLLRIPHSP